MMTIPHTDLCERLKQLGFARQHQIKLYGSEFQLVGDPVPVTRDVVFVDAIEQKSGELRRVRIPLNVVRMVTEQSSASSAA